jgi:hypothetical protein
MQLQMRVLAYLGSQCRTRNWVDVLIFTSFCLESFKWPVGIFRGVSFKGTASNFVKISEKVRTDTLAMIRQAFGEESITFTQKV